MDGPLGFTFHDNGTMVMDVEPGSQADYIQNQNLIGSTVTQVCNEQETRTVSTIEDFGEAVSDLSRPITIQFQGEQFVRANIQKRTHQAKLSPTKAETAEAS